MNPTQGVVELLPDELLAPPAGGVPLLDELDELLSGGGIVADPDIEPDAEPLTPGSLPGAGAELGGGGAARVSGAVPVAPVEPLLLYESVPDVRGWSVVSPQAVKPPRASTVAAAIRVFLMSISFGD